MPTAAVVRTVEVDEGEGEGESGDMDADRYRSSGTREVVGGNGGGADAATAAVGGGRIGPPQLLAWVQEGGNSAR